MDKIKYHFTLFPLVEYPVSHKIEQINPRSLLCSSKLHLFDQKYSKNSSIVIFFLNVCNFFDLLLF